MLSAIDGAVKRWMPAWLKRWLRRDAVRYRSQNDNVYHCTVQKCASQWVRAILSDPRVHDWCGLRPYRYQDDLPGQHDPRKLIERRFDKAFPDATVATTIYSDYAGFAGIPKPACYKAFFVMRDPRDVLVSWYFSSRFSHPLMGDLGRVRRDLEHLSEVDGLLYCIDHLEAFGLFAAQRSWADATAKDANVLLMRYEDLTGDDSPAMFAQLFAHCDIRVPADELDAILRSYRFERLSGRERGQEDRFSHHRKGIAGDWRNHFNDHVASRFEQVAGDLLSAWNYS
ncbi:MAG: sulfotransferase domain-containing protein [Planctomycetes bacterium]|nr:sulfotransferase domain-containing protein [Planctomycetota bacterium]